MKMICKSLLLVSSLFLGSYSFSQSPIPEGETEKIFFEDFTETSDKWPEIKTQSDLHLSYGDGDYVISRKEDASPYGIQPNISHIKRNFELKTSLKIGPVKTNEASIGVLVMIQPNSSGGFIFEFNKKGEYRIKELGPNSDRFHSGDDKSNGWEKSKFVNGINIDNKVLVRAYGGVYEFYCNGNLLKTVSSDSYKTGLIGLWAGSGCLAKVDYFYLYTLNIESQPDVFEEDLVAEIKDLKQEIDSLKEANIKLQYGLKEDEGGALVAIKTLEKQISKLQAEKSALELQLNEINKDESNGAVEVMDALSDELREQKERNDSLRHVNQELLSKYDILQEDFHNLKDELEKLKAQKVKEESDPSEDNNNSLTDEEQKEEENSEDTQSETENEDLITPKKVKVKTATKKVE